MPRALRFRLPALLAGALWACASAWSQTVLDNAALLGMSRHQVMPALVNAQPVRSSRRLSSGAVGSLRVPDALCEGLHFQQTLYFAHQKLEQMELVLINPAAGAGSAEAATAATFAALVQSLRKELGPELATFASSPEIMADTVSWVSAGADVTLLRSGTSEHPGVRLVIRQQRLVDASEL
ncbi:MAG: hypothetical protein JJD98_02335 [Polaromonas sp.]|nr:hypothetical protein [Polaromonas sp.]